MMRRLLETSEILAAQGLRHKIAENESQFSSQWLAASNAFVVAQESGRHIEPERAAMIADAFRATGASTLIAITNDPLIVNDEAYELRPDEADLNMLSGELIGIDFMLTEGTAQNCILFTVYDFKLIAGSLQFVTDIAGDPLAARKDFAGFYSYQSGPYRVKAIQASHYMNWLDMPRSQW